MYRSNGPTPSAPLTGPKILANAGFIPLLTLLRLRSIPENPTPLEDVPDHAGRTLPSP